MHGIIIWGKQGIKVRSEQLYGKGYALINCTLSNIYIQVGSLCLTINFCILINDVSSVLKFSVDRCSWIHYSELQTCVPCLLSFCHYHVLYQGAPHCCLSGTLQRSRCMSGTILPERRVRMPDRKLHYFFCSESVRKKKTVGNCEFGNTWVVMVVGIHLNARRFSRPETKATAG